MVALEDRVARLEAEVHIGQLVAGYAIAYDARDLDGLADAYAPQVREAAMAELVPQLPAGRTFHLVADPVLNVVGPDAAFGQVVCRAEREEGDEWIVSGLTYEDAYVRVDARWYLYERSLQITYSADVLARP